jgi:hypothetical protein
MKPNEAIKAYPLCWPDGWARTKHRQSSPYKIKTDAALDELIGSVKLMGGRDIVVSSNVPIRRDGTMYRGDHSDQRIEDPGVAVYWTARDTKGNPVPRVIPCDHWHTVRENVRALGMAIEYIRGLKRCGAGEIQERAFSGFARLPETTGEASDCWSVLGVKRTATRDQLTARLRELTRTEHPDHGGSSDGFARITRAYHEAIGHAP